MHWWAKDLQDAHDRQVRTWMHYWNQMKSKIDKGEAAECFGRQFVESGYIKKGIDELQAATVCGSKFLVPMFVRFLVTDRLLEKR